MTRATTANLYATQMKVLGLLGIMLVALGALYFYFVMMSIMHVVAREDMQMEIAQAESRIGTLESEYLVKKQAITEEFALSEGYVAVGEKQYVLSEHIVRRNVTLNQ